MKTNGIICGTICGKDLSANKNILGSKLNLNYLNIGSQKWYKNNFDLTQTALGNNIPEISLSATWATAISLYNNAYAANVGTDVEKHYAGLKAAAMCCNPDNNIANAPIYGKIYNIFACILLYLDTNTYNSNNPTNQTDYLIPEIFDFTITTNEIGGLSVAAGKMKESGTAHWNTPNTGATNESKFTALGASYRSNNGNFNPFKEFALFYGANSSTYNCIALYHNTEVASMLQPLVNGSPLVGTGISIRPLKNRKYSSVYSVVCDGDSLTLGAASGGADANSLSYPSQLARRWKVSTVNLGVGGQKLSDMEADAATQVDVLKTADRNKLVIWGGINDFAEGAVTKETIYQRYLTYCQNRKAAGWKVFALTMLPQDSFTWRPDFETERQWFNNKIKTELSLIVDGIIDVGGNALIGVYGSQNNAMYYNQDKIHLNSYGYYIVAGMVYQMAIDT